MSGRGGLLFLALLAGAPAFAQAPVPSPSPSPSPSPTPYPMQDDPPVDAGVPPGFDDAIAIPPGVTPTPAPTPDPFRMPADHDAFLAGQDEPESGGWDPRQVFPGNYYALPLTADVGWHPCLDCGGDVYQRPGAVSLWVGYALQPFPRVTSPFLAPGLQWTIGTVDAAGRWEAQSVLAPTVRWGWNLSAASVYATTGVLLPARGRERAGYHAGVGVSSFAFLVAAACSASAIPSVVEVGADFLPDEEREGRTVRAWSVKIGWGF